MTYKVLVTCKQMQESLEELLAETPMPDFSFTTPELTKQGFNSSEMGELMKGHDAAIVGDDVVDEAVLSTKGLKYVCKWGVGVDGIDFEAIERLGVGFNNTPGIFGSDVADLAFSYLIALARSTFTIHDEVRKGNWPRIRGRSLRELKVVVYGLGDIGSHLCKLLSQSGANVVGCDIAADIKIANELGIDVFPNLADACSGADALVVCSPLNSKTKQSVNEDVFASMNDDAFIVNVARGEIMNEDHLIHALESKKIAGAALDVFKNEPLERSSELRTLDSVIFGSHNASNASLSVKMASKAALAKLSAHNENVLGEV